jgi:polyisoprenoid-binding protein YceI
MTRALPFALSLLAALSVFGPARAEPAKYVIDPEHFSIAMSIRHIGYFDLVGLFTEGAGSFVFDEAKPAVTDIRVTIKTASFFSGHKKRDDHVRSADFLDAKAFPEMVFVGKSSEKTGERTGRIHGELTLRGVTRPLTLDVTWVKSGEYPIGGGLFGSKPYVTGIDARATLKRSDFGMTYALDNGLVGDDVTLMLGFEARRQAP